MSNPNKINPPSIPLKIPFPDFTKAVHVREHSTETETHLNANRRKFTGDVAVVLSLLQAGAHLTTWRAISQFSISMLPTRIWDIKNQLGIDVADEWAATPDPKVTRNKVYFLPENRGIFEARGWIRKKVTNGK